MRVEDISAVDDTLSTRICRLDIASDCGIVENAAAPLKSSSSSRSELAIIVVVAFMVIVYVWWFMFLIILLILTTRRQIKLSPRHTFKLYVRSYRTTILTEQRSLGILARVDLA